jgi:spore germination cell wall hydrolase CwlJ-like protein
VQAEGAQVIALALAALLSAAPGERDFAWDCMSLVVFHEARGEPFDGQLAVAQVLQNRVAAAWREGRTTDACKEAFAAGQFTGLDARLGQHEPQGSAWASARAAAANVLYEGGSRVPEDCRQATHFRSSKLRRERSLLPVCVVGQHTFYVEVSP